MFIDERFHAVLYAEDMKVIVGRRSEQDRVWVSRGRPAVTEPYYRLVVAEGKSRGKVASIRHIYIGFGLFRRFVARLIKRYLFARHFFFCFSVYRDESKEQIAS